MLDILQRPTGDLGYEGLARTVAVFEIGGRRVDVAALDDVIAMKAAAGRPKDRIELEILGALRQEFDHRRND
jgi:predicted nucleotidyltransferase